MRRPFALTSRQAAIIDAWAAHPYAIVDIRYTVRHWHGAAERGLMLRGLIECAAVSDWLDMSAPEPETGRAGTLRREAPRTVYRLTAAGRAALRARLAPNP